MERRPAAVLIPVVHRRARGDPAVHRADQRAPLACRADRLSRRPHRSGGRWARKQAALREAEEEIGLDPKFVETLCLGPDYLTGSGYHVAPGDRHRPAGLSPETQSGGGGRRFRGAALLPHGSRQPPHGQPRVAGRDAQLLRDAVPRTGTSGGSPPASCASSTSGSMPRRPRRSGEAVASRLGLAEGARHAGRPRRARRREGRDADRRRGGARRAARAESDRRRPRHRVCAGRSDRARAKPPG